MAFHWKYLLCFIVFEILLIYHDTGSWSKALSAGVPTGKGYIMSSEAESDLPWWPMTRDSALICLFSCEFKIFSNAQRWPDYDINTDVTAVHLWTLQFSLSMTSFFLYFCIFLHFALKHHFNYLRWWNKLNQSLNSDAVRSTGPPPLHDYNSSPGCNLF